MTIYWLKIDYFCYIFATPLSLGALAPCSPFEFRAEVKQQETSHGAILQ